MATTGFFCPHCKVRSSFTAKTSSVELVEDMHHQVFSCDSCNRGVFTVNLRIVYPSMRTESSPDLPDEVKDNFDEALRSLNISNAKSSVIMTRSALQAAMREQGAIGKTLMAEIEDLADRHVLPKSLRDWSHELRDGGNLVAHPESGKKVEIADAEELIALAESIFDYLYVIPKEVERRRSRLAAP